MEQTGIIRHEIGEYVLRFPKRPRIPVQQSGTVRGNTEGFYASWEEACRAQYGGEPRRAHYFYHQAGIVEGPNRAVIGQLITARQLLEAAHRNLRVNLTIECDGEGNVSLRSVCKKLGIAVVHTPNSRPAAASPPTGVHRPRRPPLNFRDMHIDTGSRLNWKDGPQTAVVSSDRLVIFNGKEMSLTTATSQILGYPDHPCAHWEYKESHRSRPRILSEIYEKTYGSPALPCLP